MVKRAIEKFEEITFSVKSEKIELLKEYARKHNIPFYCSVNIPKSAVPDFEKFLKENYVFDTEFEKFLEELLMINNKIEMEKNYGKK